MSADSVRMTGHTSSPPVVQVDDTSSSTPDDREHLALQPLFDQEAELESRPHDQVNPRFRVGQRVGTECAVVRRSSP